MDEKAVRVENFFLEFLKRSAPDFFLIFLFTLFGSVMEHPRNLNYSCVLYLLMLSIISFRLDPSGELFYESEIEAMKSNESTTMFIDFSHVMRYNDLLQRAISDEYLR